MNNDNRIKKLEDEIRSIKEEEKRKRAYTRAAEIAEAYPWMLDNGGTKATPVTAEMLTSGAWEFAGCDEWGFPGFGLDYGTGGAWATAAKTNNERDNRRTERLRHALSDLGYFKESKHKQYKTIESRFEAMTMMVRELIAAAKDYGIE